MPLLKPDEAARRLCISARKLWSMTKAREVPHVKLGKCIRYREEDLSAWLAGLVAASTKAAA